MKKRGIILTNILIMLAILVFVFFYTNYEAQKLRNSEIETFENMTVGMQQVTVNYLEGEQQICDVWANYINHRRLTIEEATDFVRISHVLPSASGHLIFTDDNSYEGLSTRPKAGTSDSYEVSYRSIPLFQQNRDLAELGTKINVTRAYTNPMNGTQSLAFFDRIWLKDRDTDEAALRAGLLLRVVPISELEEKWVFPREEYQNAETSLIDHDGNYIIKGKSFKNSSFFEFYKSYNAPDAAAMEQIRQDVTGSTGTLFMKNSKGEDCLIAHMPISTNEDWTILSYIPLSELQTNRTDWLLVGAVSLGLIALFIFDLFYVRLINRQLQAAAEEAEAANRAKTDFLSTISHDIRTPMNAIVGLTAITERNTGDRELVEENLRKITLASNHLLTLINDILDISKVESGKLNLSPVTFSIVETAENLVNLSQPMVKEKSIDFCFRINGMDTEYLYTDQLRLNQIFINILSNAIKYTEPGGRVEVDLREEAGEKPGCVRLIYRVADTGIGMSKEFMERMYQPFSRQTDSRVNSIQGTGLGLAITKQMVDLMQGTIDCESQPGVGTTFTVHLDIPVAEKQLGEMVLPDVDVLIADDDEILLETAKDTLESLGARTETALSGEEALAKVRLRHAEGKDYRVIILDWKMPGMDGVEAVRRIRQEIDAKIPILLISAYDWSDIEEAAREAGASGFIGKPLFKSKLYEKINELLGLKNGTAEPEEDNSDIQGMHILVAEDNDINWEIISMLLSMYGISSERAENGRVAVDMMADGGQNKYDLIFMDIQMPVMNGLEATKAIRALTDAKAASIPIIAMTADAFSENVAECLAVGMNGHIAKPVDIKIVLKEIRRIREANK